MSTANSMTTRERFKAVMNFQPFDRLPILEWAGWWNQTVDRWHEEALPVELTDRCDICRHFGLDVYLVQGFVARTEGTPTPAHHGAGIITSMDDYEKVREHLFPWPLPDAETVWETWRGFRRQQERGDVALWFSLEGPFWFPRGLLGIERHLFAFYDQPELMHRINRDLTDWQVKVVDALLEVCTPDFMSFAEDMSYNHGPMLSEELFDEFLLPYYRRVVPRLTASGVLAIVDSDGDITTPAAWFERAGLDGILPLERQAGVDVAQLRRMHPKMRFIGCFDKMTMNRGEEAMRAEFSRLLPTAAAGGLIVSCDHQTPPGVSYDDYRLYVRLFREYAEEAGRLSRQSS